MKLLVLTPDIQEEILFLERVDGVEPISERRIRMVLRFERWGEQRTVWNMYFGYFANGYGEQALYCYDYKTGEAVVRMGDCGWDNVYRVIDGIIEGASVNDAEATWIRACWLATGKNRAYNPSSNRTE